MVKLTGRTIDGWAIFNHMGSPWTSMVFAEEVDAVDYLDLKRSEWKRKGWGSLDKHRVHPVKAVVSPRERPKSPAPAETPPTREAGQ